MGNVEVMIDSNNNDVTKVFRIAKDSTTIGGGTELFKIEENAIATFSGYIVPLITDTDGTVEGSIWYDASENKLKFRTSSGVETITSA